MASVKTAMMLLVVLYHSCVMWAGGGWFDMPAVPCEPLGTFALWLNTFHVPSFVFASGYVHSYLRRETGHYGNAWSVLARKVRRLLVPCVLVSLLWAAPAYGFVYGLDELVGKFVLMAAPSQLWFLPMLFWCFVAAELTWRFVPNLLRSPDVRVGSILVILAIGSPVVSKVTGGAFQLASACQYLVVFWAGWAFRSVDAKRFWTISPFGLVAADAALFFFWRLVSGEDGIVASLASQVVLIVLRLFGCAMALSVAGRLKFPRDRVWGVLGRDSFGIYLFHQQLVWVVLSFLNDSDVFPVLAASIAFIFSLTVSMGMTELFGKFRPTRIVIGKG